MHVVRNGGRNLTYLKLQECEKHRVLELNETSGVIYTIHLSCPKKKRSLNYRKRERVLERERQRKSPSPSPSQSTKFAQGLTSYS